jgi:hypothetical protein
LASRYNTMIRVTGLKVRTEILPDKAKEYLSTDKIYTVRHCYVYNYGTKNQSTYGNIINDEGTKTYICIESCAHLGNRAWQVVE